MSYAERHMFTLDGSGDGLSEKADVEIRYLTSRSTDWNEFGVYEQYFATVVNLRAELNGKRLGRDAIQRIQPEREDVFLASGTLHHIDLPTAPNPGDVLRYSYERTYLSAAYAPILRVPDVNRMSEYVIEVEHPLMWRSASVCSPLAGRWLTRSRPRKRAIRSSSEISSRWRTSLSSRTTGCTRTS